MSTARQGPENGIIQRRDRTCGTVGRNLGNHLHWPVAVGYIKAVNIRDIDKCDMPSARRWLLLMIITKSSQENINT